MDSIKISIAKDFSITPGPRYIEEGDFSGEKFRTTILEVKYKEALAKKRKLIVDLDGTMGYGTSFLEEVFGGLARQYGADQVLSVLEIHSQEEEYLKDDINGYIKDTKSQAHEDSTHN